MAGLHPITIGIIHPRGAGAMHGDLFRGHGLGDPPGLGVRHGHGVRPGHGVRLGHGVLLGVGDLHGHGDPVTIVPGIPVLVLPTGLCMPTIVREQQDLWLQIPAGLTTRVPVETITAQWAVPGLQAVPTAALTVPLNPDPADRQPELPQFLHARMPALVPQVSRALTVTNMSVISMSILHTRLLLLLRATA